MYYPPLDYQHRREQYVYIVSMLFDDFLKTAKDIKVNAYTAQELSSTMTLNF